MTPASATPGPPATSRGRARGERTRERILEVAERLWGERGVDGVSLREIRIAAGQRNSSALQFHFGSRDGLVRALAERHLPRVTELQERLYAEALAAGRGDDLAALVEVLVRPQADYLRLGPSQRAWVKVCAELAARPEVSVEQVLGSAPAVALHVGTAVHERLVPTLGSTLAVERIMAVTTAANHLCADRARAEDAGPPAEGRVRPLLPFEAWRDNLLDMAIGALTAPRRGRGRG